MRAGESKQFSNISAATAAFKLYGGKYQLAVVAAFGGGTVLVQELGADGVEGSGPYRSVGMSLAANGVVTGDLPPGEYIIAVVTATAVYAMLTRIPEE